MTSRERITLLLKKQLPDHMGLYEHFWPETLRDYWTQQGYPKDAEPQKHFDYDLWGCGGWFNSAPFIRPEELLEETDEWKVTRNGHGARLKHWKKKSGTPEHIGFDVTTPEIWKKYREPLLATDRARLGNLEEAKQKLAEARAAGKFAVFGNLFIFELLRGTLGDETFLPAMLLEPAWIHDFCQVYLDSFKRHYEILFREAGTPDGFFLYEDFGYRNGLFCSPQTMKELVFPYEKALVSFFKDYGLPVILHSCGDVRKAVPQVIDAGFDCLQPMEAKAGCDVLAFARTYGSKLAYMGNINVVPLGTNDPVQVKNEIVPKLTELRRMRIPYIFHSDHSIPPEISLATYKGALQLLKEHGNY
ncbi:MAG: uroporphyrinogen decarboxylase family protein [Planctomycetota bacterium]